MAIGRYGKGRVKGWATKPPPGAVINLNNPITQFLKSLWLFNEGSGQKFNDSVGNAPGSGVSGVVRNQQGAVFAGSTYINVNSASETAEANKKFSFVAKIKTNTGNNCAIAATWASGSKAGFYILLNSSGAGIFSVGMASASNAAYIQKDTSISVRDGKEHTIGFDYDGSQTLAGLKIFIDGLEIGGTTNYIAGTIGAFSHTGFNLGADGAGNSKYVGGLGFAAMFIGGNLGATGHRALHENPYQLIVPTRRVSWNGTAGTDVTAALTGATATFTAGTVAPASTVALTDNTTTGSAGTLTPVAAVVLSGLSVTGTPGTVTIPSTGGPVGRFGPARRKPYVINPPPAVVVDFGRSVPAPSSLWLMNEGAGQKIGDTSRSLPNAGGSGTGLTWSSKGLTFDGSTSFVDVSGANTGLLKDSRFSGLAQFRTTGSGTAKTLIGAWAVGTSPGWTFYVTSTGELQFLFTSSIGTNYFAATTTTRYNDGKSHIATFTCDGSAANTGIAIHVDGVKCALTLTTGGAGNPGTVTNFATYIGKRGGATPQYFSGQITCAALWVGKTLNDRQVVTLQESLYDIVVSPKRVELIAVQAGASLTGVTTTASPGTVTPSLSVPLTGESGTLSAGTVTPNIDYGSVLTGETATGTAGTVAPSTDVPIVGEVTTATPGTVVVEFAQSISGETGAVSAGDVSPSVEIALTGQTITSLAGDVSPVGGEVTIALTGVTATLTAGDVTAIGGSSGIDSHDGGWKVLKDKPRKWKNEREAIKTAILRAMDGPEADEVLESISEYVAPVSAKKTTVSQRIDWDAVYQQADQIRAQIEAIKRRIEQEQEDDDEEALLMLL